MCLLRFWDCSRKLLSSIKEGCCKVYWVWGVIHSFQKNDYGHFKQKYFGYVPDVVLFPKQQNWAPLGCFVDGACFTKKHKQFLQINGCARVLSGMDATGNLRSTAGYIL